MDIQRPILYLEESGFKLPYGIIPGSFPGGINSEFTKERWESIIYNPPDQFPEYVHPDHAASPQPTWAELEAADLAAETRDFREELIEQVNEEATVRISRLYHSSGSRNKEFQVRLSGRDLTKQDAEREKLVDRCHVLEERLMKAATLTELQAIDVTDDANWAITS